MVVVEMVNESGTGVFPPDLIYIIVPVVVVVVWDAAGVAIQSRNMTFAPFSYDNMWVCTVLLCFVACEGQTDSGRARGRHVLMTQGA